MEAIRIVDYSDRAVAVIGETKSMKETLKSLGGRFNPRLSCGSGWIFPKTKMNELCEIISGADVDKTTSCTKQKESKEELVMSYRKELEKVYGNDTHMIDFCIKKASQIVRLSDGKLYIIDKHKLDTCLCYGYQLGDSGESYEDAEKCADYARKSEKPFRNKNVRDIEEMIESLKKEESLLEYLYIMNHYSRGNADIVMLCTVRPYELEHEQWRFSDCTIFQPLNKEDKKTILAAYKKELKFRNKQIDQYLKRYGTSKLQIHTYWIDE